MGNLSAGGTGKTPLIEYLIFQLQYIYKVATLSRGYGRRQHGFIVAAPNSPATQIGDEPRQFKFKFPETIVAVDEERVFGIPKVLAAHPETDVILMDDAFQHRTVRAGLSILLTAYNNLFTRDALIPAGMLREAKGNYHRADIIIVTKCPPGLSMEDQQRITGEIKPLSYQKLYFSTIQYAPLYSFYNPMIRVQLSGRENVVLVCGIANFGELKDYLQSQAANVYMRDFNDHHRFDLHDLSSIRETFNNVPAPKVMITTEKDAARLHEHFSWLAQNRIELYVQPIVMQFLFDDGAKFNSDILKYIEVTKQKNQS